MKARAFKVDASCACRKAQGGFTLLEIMISVFILVIGLLGLAGMLVVTQQSEVEAYQRKQALVLLQDMVDRMTSNPVAASCYVTASGPLGTGSSGPAGCGAGSVTQLDRANKDLAAWHDGLLGASEHKSAVDTTKVGGIIDARGCVTSPSTGVYVVSVAWRGIASTFEPPTALTCGEDLYKNPDGTVNDRLRRVISVTIRIANLTA